MQISKTDLRDTIRYLEGAVKVYAGLPKTSSVLNRIRLLNNHINKLKNKLK